MSILNQNVPISGLNGVLVDMFDQIIRVTLGYHFEHGHPTDVLQRLIEIDKDPELRSTKYPVVCLFQDIPENNTGTPIGIDYETNCHLIIANLTEATYRAPERYTVNFRPILYPMYEAIKNAIFESGYFMLTAPTEIKHMKMDRVFWGQKGLYGVDGNIFQDRIDAIEITNMKLLTYINNC